jgi:putative acetyltransferase
MSPDISIRSEADGDEDAITEVTAAAFEELDLSNHTEQLIVIALRAAEALSISLVAEVDDRIVGHIAFSPVTISDGTRDWYGLGPVSVLPEYQRQGIGGALVEEGIALLRTRNAQGCCLVGHPDYYGRFGFENPSELAMEGVPREAFFALSFEAPIPKGEVTFHEAFELDH